MIVAEPRAILAWFREQTGDTCEVLLNRLSHANAIWICGGSILSCLLDKKLNDLDVCVDGDVTRQDLIDRFEVIGTNFFGGPIFEHKGLKMDIWPLDDSVLIADLGLERS